MNIEYDENADKSSADLRIRKTQVSLITIAFSGKGDCLIRRCLFSITQSKHRSGLRLRVMLVRASALVLHLLGFYLKITLRISPTVMQEFLGLAIPPGAL